MVSQNVLSAETLVGVPPVSAPPVPRRMLVVDDEHPILFAMKAYFTMRGFKVDCAQEKEEAEALLNSVYYSVVIVDLRLTGINGTEGLEIIGGIQERYPDTRIILLTAYGSPEIEAEAKHRGADALLHKPQRLPAVAKIVFELLGEEKNL